MKLFPRAVAVVALLTGFGLRPSEGQTSPGFDASYLQHYNQWKTQLDQDRRERWLTLAGLFWLKPGDNRLGSAADSAVVLPGKGVPADAGTIKLAGKDVTVAFAPGVKALLDGAPSAGGKLAADVAGHPTVVEIGSLRFEVIQRGERTGIRLWDMERAEAKAYRGAIFYPPKPAYRVLASWVPYDKPTTIRVPNVLGDVSETPAMGEVRASIDGQGICLVAVGGDPAHGFFLIFSDPTRKTETYPAGRFLDTGPVQDGKVVLDFNYAYNPPCALTPYATCPLPPAQNQLAVPVPAGERYDRAHSHH